MAGVCKLVGGLVLLIGVLFAGACVTAMARDEAYAKAKLVASRNPGNVLYEAEFKGAQVQRAFQLVGAAGGALLGLNGLTLILLGAVAGRAAGSS
ncbi:MAG TPA: hypothetical protein VL403_01125 [Candidatus Kryptonia bacterium]|nr:hypothetical protein [Candidatus Kryptonia bacterium]